jgi:hypothetical protein
MKGLKRQDSTQSGVSDEYERYDTDREPELPRIVLVLGCQQPQSLGMRILLSDADELVLRRGQGRRITRIGRCLEMLIDDNRMSSHHAALRRTVTGWELVDLESKNGTHINGDLCRKATLADGDLVEVGSTMLIYREDGVLGGGSGMARDRDLANEVEDGRPLAFRTLALEFERRLSQLVQVAPSRVPVFISGESGSGKELIARAVHELSGRRGPFVAINCGALPRALVESELFGYRRGAFSDAKDDREGLVRHANGGTLFLDEVAELPPESQVALLRFLQEGEVRPIGAVESLRVDVRVIAATHQEIVNRVAEGKFRQDLYARLAGFEILLPPLRERREDVGTLIAAILEKLGDDAGRVTFHRGAARILVNYTYPLNIRELEQALSAAVLFARGRKVCIPHLPERMQNYRPYAPTSLKPEDRAFRERLLEILRETRGNVAETGRVIEKAPTQIRRWCRRYGIDLGRFRE